MFERFTDRARRVLVLAQEEARLLDHGFIGTEHLLLGLIQEEDGVASVALVQLGISLEDVRARVHDVVGASITGGSGSPPFTPRAKKVLELALREALQLGHNYIGTEHILLGLVREGDGVAAHVLVGLGLDLTQVRQQVLRLLSGHGGTGSEITQDASPGTPRFGGIVACSFCGRRPPDSGRLVSGRGGAFICQRCLGDLSALLAEEDEDVPGVFVQPVVISGAAPDDIDAAHRAIALAFAHALVLSDDRRTVPNVEGGELLAPCLKEAQERHAALRRKDHTIAIERVQFIDTEHASVWFVPSLEGLPSDRRRGDAVLVDSTWKMARTTFCELMYVAGVECPPIS
jgi:hypothetical protein